MAGAELQMGQRDGTVGPGWGWGGNRTGDGNTGVFPEVFLGNSPEQRKGARALRGLFLPLPQLSSLPSSGQCYQVDRRGLAGPSGTQLPARATPLPSQSPKRSHTR